MIETRDAEAVARAEDVPPPVVALRARFATYRHAEYRALVRVCVAAAYASALRVPYWMAHSQRDYASAILGVKHPSYCRWVKVGRLLCAHPELRVALHAGRVTMSQLEALAAGKMAVGEPDTSDKPSMRGEPHAKGESSVSSGLDTPARDSFVTLSITAPAPAVLYVENTLQLARGFVGASDGDEDALSALLAESASDCTYGVDPLVARARFKVKGAKQRDTHADAGAGANKRDGQADETTTTAAWEPGRQLPSLAQLPLPTLGEAARRKAAFRLHTILARLIARREQLGVRQEDKLYEWRLQGVHDRTGFRTFEAFAEKVLDLPYSTCRDRLRHARLRLHENAIAIARRDAEVTAVQAALLDKLYRECFVPASDLPHWCAYAAIHTVRRLRTAIRWAKREISLDYRRWSLSHCAPPDEDQLRTTDQSLEALVRDSGTGGLTNALLNWELAPRGTIRLLLSHETCDELLVQMASMQDEIRGRAPRRVPSWFALCLVFHRARETWRVHYQAPPAALRRILDRDGYQCAAPECTQRKNLQVHHVKYRSQGGDDCDSNRVTLCAFHHHHGEHGGLMRVRGELDTHGRGLTWEMGLDEHGRAQGIYQDERVLVTVPDRSSI